SRRNGIKGNLLAPQVEAQIVRGQQVRGVACCIGHGLHGLLAVEVADHHQLLESRLKAESRAEFIKIEEHDAVDLVRKGLATVVAAYQQWLATTNDHRREASIMGRNQQFVSGC